ncbi:MFS transporter, partial [Rhizobium ruizarguesonis]
SLVMATVPEESRGIVSGILQAGSPSGYLIASLVFFLLFPVIVWRGMFFVGAVPALLVLYIRRNVEESPAYLKRQAEGRRPFLTVLRENIPLFIG